ncbi:MAG: hypothetical protein ACYTAF_08690 [Planctomycetota bacterium]|jgi:hypothetical protein
MPSADIEPLDLEVYTRIRGPEEHHFYSRGLSFNEFAAVFDAELRRSKVLVYHMPPALLNPDFWEPLTRETEEEVRNQKIGIITRREDDRLLLWRSDRVPPDRLLCEGLDVEANLQLGFIFRVPGEGVIELGRAAAERNERLEWIAFPELPSGEISHKALLLGRTGLTQMRHLPEQATILYSSQDDRSSRVLFSERPMLRKALSALVRGFARARTGRPVAAINDAVAEDHLPPRHHPVGRPRAPRRAPPLPRRAHACLL